MLTVGFPKINDCYIITAFTMRCAIVQGTVLSVCLSVTFLIHD